MNTIKNTSFLLSIFLYLGLTSNSGCNNQNDVSGTSGNTPATCSLDFTNALGSWIEQEVNYISENPEEQPGTFREVKLYNHLHEDGDFTSAVYFFFFENGSAALYDCNGDWVNHFDYFESQIGEGYQEIRTITISTENQTNPSLETTCSLDFENIEGTWIEQEVNTINTNPDDQAGMTLSDVKLYTHLHEDGNFNSTVYFFFFDNGSAALYDCNGDWVNHFDYFKSQIGEDYQEIRSLDI